jgi:hypothetical protein
MLAGVFRFVCCNGLVVGQIANDIRIPHKGNIQHEVIDGAFRVLEDFTLVNGSVDAMKALTLTRDEEHALAAAALATSLCVALDGVTACPSGRLDS